MRYGFAVPVFANPGVPYFRTPNLESLSWPELMSVVQEAETLGFDSLWVADHLFIGTTGETFECWTVLAALASMTQRVRLGPIHLGNYLRSPTVLGKMAATLDVISAGRVDLFLEPGWRVREHEAYGLPWDDAELVRVDRLRESIEALRMLWTGEIVNYRGNFVTLHDAVSLPAPRQADGPPIWLGDSFSDAGRKLIAEQADVWNSMPASVEVLREKIILLDDACEKVGRDPRSLRKTLETQVLVYEHEDEARALFDHFEQLSRSYPAGPFMSDVLSFVLRGNPDLGPHMDLPSLQREFIIGTPEEVRERLRQYSSLGIDEVICWFMDYPSRSSMRRFAQLIAS